MHARTTAKEEKEETPMKIKFIPPKPLKKQLYVGDLEPGQVFTAGPQKNCFLLKLTGPNEAAELETGKVLILANSCPVELINGSFVEEE